MIWLTLKNGKGARMQTNLLNDKGKNHTFLSFLILSAYTFLRFIYLFILINYGREKYMIWLPMFPRIALRFSVM